MKKLNSLQDLKSLIPKKYKPEVKPVVKRNKIKQSLQAHYSKKGRAGKPVIILKGFMGLNRNELRSLSKHIKNKLGIGGSIKNNEMFLQGDKREGIISILESEGHYVKRIGG